MAGTGREKKHEGDSESIKYLKKIYSSIGHGKLVITGSSAHTSLYSLSAEAIVLQKIMTLGDNEPALIAFLKSKVSGQVIAKEKILQILIKAKEEANESLPPELQKLSLTSLKQASRAFHDSKRTMSQLGQARGRLTGY